MATTTLIELGGTSATGRFKAAAKRAFGRMVAAREREARRQVALYLSNMDPVIASRYGWGRPGASALEKRPLFY